MSLLKRVLILTPQSDASWHCPWFLLILLFAANGGFFGAVAYFGQGAWPGLIAMLFAVLGGAFALGSRSREGASC